jgi:isoamylase
LWSPNYLFRRSMKISEHVHQPPDTLAGNPFPLGATLEDGGVNFCVFSRNATGVELLTFNTKNDEAPARIIKLDPVLNRTANYWHVFVPGITAGQIYGYHVHGPDLPMAGFRFDAEKLLLDPYGLSVAVPDNYQRERAIGKGNNSAFAMKSVVVDLGDYDWEGDHPLNRPSSQTIIYEMHVRGFTINPNSGLPDDKRGTYAGLIEKIPYLKALGITAVELLPVFQFDLQDAAEGRNNYWGYSPVSFFAPHHQYSSRKDPAGCVSEFRDMVKALHRAGIEVILDVVYNHTAEGNEAGPTICYRGFENEAYYILESDKSRYANYTGCGNTLNTNQPECRRIIIDSLHYWVTEMHVDGFRFDLTSILTRDFTGTPMTNPPVVWDIDSDPVLAGTKLIAEAWDAAGLYQVGSFVGDKWKEWNGQFRDDIRRFLRGDRGMIKIAADRILGSPDIYGFENREAEQSVNFVTCHDGFTLHDLVSFDKKYNEDNGEGNRDGNDCNFSWNCGEEGETSDPGIQNLRLRQMKNFFTVNILSLGVPMILMGDEVGHSQRGNNNAYCQDNELSWFDWTEVEKNADLLRFARTLIGRRSERDLKAEQRRASLMQVISEAQFEFHGVQLNDPDWSERSHSLAVLARNFNETFAIYWILNAYWEPLTFELPHFPNGWRRWIDTSLNSPEDITDWRNPPAVDGHSYKVRERSMVLLISFHAKSKG